VITIASDKQGRDTTLLALADPTRARIVEMLSTRPHTAGEIHRAFEIANPAVSRHLRVLREAGLVTESTPPDDGRVRVYALNATPIEELRAWLDGMENRWQSQLDSFKDFVALRTERPKGKRR
jgi:DNA-binding transcriptional ArsR family regulator